MALGANVYISTLEEQKNGGLNGKDLASMPLKEKMVTLARADAVKGECWNIE